MLFNFFDEPMMSAGCILAADLTGDRERRLFT